MAVAGMPVYLYRCAHFNTDAKVSTSDSSQDELEEAVAYAMLGTLNVIHS